MLARKSVEKRGEKEFLIFAKNAKKVSLEFFRSATDREAEAVYEASPKDCLGDYWRITVPVEEGQLYLWKVDGERVLDPWARAYTGQKKVEEKKAIYVKEGDYQEHVLRKKADMVIYEVHLGFFTEEGTYKAFQEKIPYLLELGVNTVEFLPVFEWDAKVMNKGPKGEHLENAWGYNPISFFAPTKEFATDKKVDSFAEVEEFKELVQALHEAQIGVLLDVVYNHTAEGGERGWRYNFKALGEDVFYLKDADGSYANYSGCGNTLACHHKVVKDLIVDSLRYWYLEMGVDGFRFDLAPILGRNKQGQWQSDGFLEDLLEDPILSHACMISESWDLGGYFVGQFPTGWSEWNGYYRDCMRAFVRGDYGQLPALLEDLLGSSKLFHGNEEKSQASINFICCHDGFTLWDLVSYDKKHNLANGEEDRDGENHNLSCNHGVEGETKDPAILKLRKQQVANFIMLLFLSQGIPMLGMGDECGRTQQGNNNAYCQKSDITKMDWERAKEFSDIQEIVKKMSKLRREYEIFRREEKLKKNVDYRLHGVKLNHPDMEYYSLTLAVEYLDEKAPIYVVINSYVEDLDFMLPPLKEGSWEVYLESSSIGQEEESKTGLEGSYKVASKSISIFVARA